MVRNMRKRKVILIIVITFLLILIIPSLYIYLCVKPVLAINGEQEIIIPLNENYNEEGAKLTILNKDYSKDIKIRGEVDSSKVGTYEINYSFNTKYLKHTNEEKRIVKVVDNISPEITLKGKKEYTIYFTDTKKAAYKEEGYTAIDNYDGDITDNVEVIDEVDYKTKGQYKIIYKVKDSSGNEVNTERIINVKKKVISAVTNGTGRGIPILMYHFFYSEENGEVAKDNNYLEIKLFEEQIKYLKDNNYYFPTWDEVRAFIDGKKTLPEKSVVITIDDWHKSVPLYAVPILNKYGVPATCFLMTRWETGMYFKNYSSPYINFGSHTHDMHWLTCDGYGKFTCINHNDGLKDLQTSISIVGNSDVLAYPFGHVNEQVLAITKEAGFKVGLTTVFGKAKKGMDPYLLPRIRVVKGESLSTFIKNL